MEENIFWAKSNPQQTIEEHTNDCLKLMWQMKSLYPSFLTEKEWAMLFIAIFYHDFGKIDVKFQNKLRAVLKLPLLLDQNNSLVAIPHNYLSPAFIEHKLLKQMGFTTSETEIIYKAIYYHHEREENKKTLDDYVRDYLLALGKNFSFVKIDVPDIEKDSWMVNFLEEFISSGYTPITRTNSRYMRKINFNDEEKSVYIKIKGLLNRIDYSASAGLSKLEQGNKSSAGKYLTDIILEKYQLNDVQEYMYKNREENLVVIAATGSGKTEGALLWLDNAKGFYTLPLKVSINAIYERIKGRLNYDKVGLLHSGARAFYFEQDKAKKTDEDILTTGYHLHYTQSKLLSQALTVCTIDQLFKFVYKFNGGEMSLATLAHSKLIIDEIQMYSPELLATIIVALKQIVGMGGKFAIITATFPPILRTLMQEEEIYFAMASKAFPSPISERHRLKLLDTQEFDYEDIIQLAKTKKVLLIANTVRRAQEIYKNLLKNTAEISIRLLHSGFIKKHRQVLEQNILAFASNEQDKRNELSGIWVSTQIVEASLDIDFDILFSEMCSIDSLLQRMGRVYRSRSYKESEPNIFVLANNSGRGQIIDQEIYDYSLKAVQSFDGELLSENSSRDMKQEMISMVYDEEENPKISNSIYLRKIKETIRDLKNLPFYELDSKDVGQQFRAIDAITVIPKIVYNELVETGMVDRWQSDLQNKNISNDLKHMIKEEIAEYTLSLSYYKNLPIDSTSELIYKGSHIHYCDCEYLFSEDNSSGFIRRTKKELLKEENNIL